MKLRLLLLVVIVLTTVNELQSACPEPCGCNPAPTISAGPGIDYDPHPDVYINPICSSPSSGCTSPCDDSWPGDGDITKTCG